MPKTIGAHRIQFKIITEMVKLCDPEGINSLVAPWSERKASRWVTGIDDPRMP